MYGMFFLLIAGGMAMIAAALPSIRSILHALGSGALQRRWLWLQRLIVIFLVGYAAFGAAHIPMQVTIPDMIVAAILLAGGAFVLIVARLSDMTTRDIIRIASLERDVMRDPLTGVYNRRYLDGRLDEELSRARRSGSPLSALMVDLDHFKHVNDTYGHDVGDQVLRHVSALMENIVRTSDVVTRYGGEEFVILAPDSPSGDARHLGERLLHHIRDQTMSLFDGKALPVTASIGVATLKTDESQSAFLRRMDEALYHAKRSGRDRLCIAGQLEQRAV